MERLVGFLVSFGTGGQVSSVPALSSGLIASKNFSSVKVDKCVYEY